MAQGVSVYNTGGSFIEDLGKTVLPAAIKPFDFSSLDAAIEAENEIGDAALATVMGNVKDMGRIRDELTSIITPSEYHRLELENKKKAMGLDDMAFSQAVNNIDNPMAMFEVDRKMKKLQSDPAIKDAMYDGALVDAYKLKLPTITDPALRILAIKSLDEATKSMEPGAIKELNLDQYKTVDLETLYTAALDQFAPFISKSEQRVGPYGNTYTYTYAERDKDMIAKTRFYFQKEKTIQNNLKSKGYVDTEGKPTPQQGGGTWFDDIEAAQSAPMEEISNVRGPQKTSSGGGSGRSGDYSYTPTPGLAISAYTPNVYSDEDSGLEFDLGAISAVETQGRDPKNLAHMDPISDTIGWGERGSINIGAYSFNGGVSAQKFLAFVKENAVDNGVFPGAAKAIDELLNTPLKMDTRDHTDKTGNKIDPAKVAELKERAEHVRKLYKQLDGEMGGTALKDLEDQFAAKEFGVPAIKYLRGLEGMKDISLTKGDTTLLMDTAIQWGNESWGKIFKNFAAAYRDNPNISLQKFITEERVAFGNKIFKAKDPGKAQAYNDRANKMWTMADNIDNGAAAEGKEGAVHGAPVSSAMLFNASTFGMTDPDVRAAGEAATGQQSGTWGLK